MSPDDVHLSVLAVGEIRKGIEALRSRDPRQAARLETWLRSLVTDYEERILPIDRSVAEAWGTIGALRPLAVVDGLMAATAIVHDLVLVTRNVSNVRGTGARWLDPFAGRESG